MRFSVPGVKPLAQATASGDVPALTISGLDGDAQVRYLIEFNLGINIAGGNLALNMNGSPTLRTERLFQGGDEGPRTDGVIYISGGQINYNMAYGWGTMYVARRANKYRCHQFCMTYAYHSPIAGVSARVGSAIGFVEDDTDNLTELTLSFTNDILDGSTFTVWQLPY